MCACVCVNLIEKGFASNTDYQRSQYEIGVEYETTP